MKFVKLLILAVIVPLFSCKQKSSENKQMGNAIGTLSATTSSVSSEVLGFGLKETETVPGKIIFRSISSPGAAVNAQGFKNSIHSVDSLTRLIRILNRSETANIKKTSLFEISNPSNSDSLLTKKAAATVPLAQAILSVYEIVAMPALQELNEQNTSRTKELIRLLNKENPGTAFPEIKAYAFLNTNDPYIPPSKGAWNQAFFDLWGLDKINATQAWGISQGDEQIVAVIDTGVDSLHEDLVGQVIPGFNAIYNINNAFDDHGHGTHVAGTIAAIANNAKGIAGVAPKSKILPVKVLDYRGTGELSVIASGIKWAADNGATVINMSLGAFINPENVPLYLSDAMTYAYGKGIPIVVAAGNSSLNMRSFSPANDPHAFSVAATNSQDQLATFSNFGPRLGISAPGGGDTTGGDVLSAIASILSLKSSGSKITSSYNVGENYLRLAGTSMAAPHIAGTAALLKSKYPNYTIPQIYQAMRISADDISMPGLDDKTGPGRVNALKTLTAPTPLAVLLTSVMPSKSFISAETSIAGVVGGENLKSWSLEYSLQNTSILNWLPLASSSAPINGEITKWTIPKNLLDKSLVLRLKAENTAGQEFEVRQDTTASEKKASLSIVGFSKYFSDIVVGKSEKKLLTLKNYGELAGTVQSTTFDLTVYTLTGGSFPGVKGTCNDVVAPDEECLLEIEFTPTKEQIYEGFMNVAYFDGLADARTAARLIGYGHKPRALIESTRGSYINFDSTDFDQSSFATAEIVNRGELDAQILNWRFTGFQFKFRGASAAPGMGGTCESVLKAGSSCIVNLEFLASSEIEYVKETLSFDYAATDKPAITFTFQLEAKADNLYPWRNRKNNVDVDNDGSVSPLDVLAVTNEINLNGARRLDTVGPTKAPFYYYDANGDGFISPLDILMIVNFLNRK